MHKFTLRLLQRPDTRDSSPTSPKETGDTSGILRRNVVRARPVPFRCVTELPWQQPQVMVEKSLPLDSSKTLFNANYSQTLVFPHEHN